MKVILLTISMLTLGLTLNAQEAEKNKDAKAETKKDEKKLITFSTELIERSSVPYDSQELFIFEFKNTGKTPLLIQNVQASCGCTTPSKPEEPIQPGKKGEIKVKYDTKRVGDFHKTITVTTNVQTEPIILTIKGKVLPQEVKPTEQPQEQPKN
jgi:hypothetical protein